MNSKKTIFEGAHGRAVDRREQEDRQRALEYLAEAWNAAADDGVEQAALAHASLFAALATLVKLHGDDGAAELVRALPERIRCGEYNIDRRLQ